jgi:hypothetical protein
MEITSNDGNRFIDKECLIKLKPVTKYSGNRETVTRAGMSIMDGGKAFT